MFKWLILLFNSSLEKKLILEKEVVFEYVEFQPLVYWISKFENHISWFHVVNEVVQCVIQARWSLVWKKFNLKSIATWDVGISIYWWSIFSHWKFFSVGLYFSVISPIRQFFSLYLEIVSVILQLGLVSGIWTASVLVTI